MKKLFYILAAVATLSMTSCSDLLDEVNYGNPTVGDLLQKEENAVLLFGQSYADLKWIHDHWGYWGVSSLTADECLNPVRNPGKHWADGGYWKNLNVHTWDPGADAFENIWNSTITGAVNCNQLLQTFADNKESISEEAYNMYVGELEVLRCYYYYLIFDCFGRIPYLEEYVERAEPLMEPHLVWSYLVSCLEKNAPNLAVVDDENRPMYLGRVTQGFAYGLLARLYLNAESFGCSMTDPAKLVFPEEIFVKEIPTLPETATAEEKEANAKLRLLPTRWNGTKSFYTCAVECCDEVINSGSYSIEKNYFDNFLIKNEESRENMFVIVEDGRANFDNRSNGSMSNKLRVQLLTLHYSHQKAYNMIEKPWNGFCARPQFMERYNDCDVRGAGYEKKGTENTHQWAWFVGPIKANGSMVLDENGKESIITVGVDLDNAEWGSGARMMKYEIDQTGTYAYGENDFVLMRYADILWMKEEAILRGGEGVSGYNSDDFKTLRARAFANPDKDGNNVTFEEKYPELATLEAADLELILDERGREFSWEMVRRRDLIRYDKFGSKDYVQFVTGTSEHLNWFPIPSPILEKSPRKNGEKLWTQNPGY